CHEERRRMTKRQVPSADPSVASAAPVDDVPLEEEDLLALELERRMAAETPAERARREVETRRALGTTPPTMHERSLLGGMAAAERDDGTPVRPGSESDGGSDARPAGRARRARGSRRWPAPE